MRARRVGRGLGVAVAAVVPAIAVAGCATTIDNGKAEQLIRNSINSTGHAKVKSVSCPSGVTAKAGGTFTCQLTVTTPDGATHSGSVTLHMTDSKGHVEAGGSDFHVQ
jgi:pyrroline-5-carboxylate reductase